MKIKATCMQCAQEYFVNLPLNTPMIYPFDSHNTLDFNDDLISAFTCEKGHKNIICISNPKYELLFDMGVCAVADGNYREAVADIAASLERFYEYCINAFICQDNDHGISCINDYWKSIKLSERQYGAYVSLYLYNLGHLPDEKEKEKKASFRNNVIHNGYFPSREETIKYAEYVAKYITNTVKDLSQKLELCRASYVRVVKNINKCKDSGISPTSSLLSTALRIYTQIDDFEQFDFEQFIMKFRKNAERQYSFR